MTEWDEAEQRVEKAHELYERGHWLEALDELRAAIAINPYNGSWHYNLGLTYDALDRFDEAMTAYKSALEMEPGDMEVLLALGQDCNRSGRFDEAIEQFQKVEEMDGACEQSYCHRIVSYAEKGEHERAEEMFYLARQHKEKCPFCFYNIGNSLFSRGLFDRALWCWQQVLEMAPDYPQVHARIGDACWAKKQMEEAREHFIEELRSNPGDIDVLLDLGELLVEMGERSAAAEKFRQVLELRPEECTALFHLGELALEAGDYAGALEQFRRVVKHDRGYPAAHLKLALIYHRQGARAEALYHGNCELAQQAHDEETLLEVGNLLMDLGQLASAEVAFGRVLAANPRSAPARHNLAVTLLMAGRTDEGIDQAKHALRIQPKYMLAMHNLALAYLSKRDFVRAKFWLREAMDISPDDAQLRQLRRRVRVAGWVAAVRRLPRQLLRRG